MRAASYRYEKQSGSCLVIFVLDFERKLGGLRNKNIEVKKIPIGKTYFITVDFHPVLNLGSDPRKVHN